MCCEALAERIRTLGNWRRWSESAWRAVRNRKQGRKVLGAVAAGILTCIVTMVIFRDATAGSRARFFGAASRLSLPFTANDNYDSIVSRIGYPDSSRSRVLLADGRSLYLLRYPDRGFTLVLSGGDRAHAFYLGALGRGGRVVHSVMLPNGQDSTAFLIRMR